MTVRKLPVLATVAATYRSVKAHAADLALLSRTTAIIAAAAGVLGFGAVQLLPADDQRGGAFLALPAGERVASYTSLAVLVVAVGVFIVIVRWHRMIVRDTEPAATRAGATRAAMLYFVRGMLLGWLGAAIAVVLGLLPVTLSRDVPIPGDVRWWFTLACIIGGIVAALFVVVRFSLVLPAGAVGDYRLTLSRAWSISRGNGWRLVTGSLLSSGPMMAANIGLNGLLEALPTMSASEASLVAALVLSLLLFVVTAIVQASFLSYAYRYLADVGVGAAS